MPRRKFKRMRHQSKGVREWLARFRRAAPDLFAHWKLCQIVLSYFVVGVWPAACVFMSSRPGELHPRRSAGALSQSIAI
jgi:hypothetical protein